MSQAEVLRLQATFRAAIDFGLSDEEVRVVVNEICAQVPDSRPAEVSIGRLAIALAELLVEHRHEL
jgi:hypothetical protein